MHCKYHIPKHRSEIYNTSIEEHATFNLCVVECVYAHWKYQYEHISLPRPYWNEFIHNTPNRNLFHVHIQIYTVATEHNRRETTQKQHDCIYRYLYSNLCSYYVLLALHAHYARWVAAALLDACPSRALTATPNICVCRSAIARACLRRRPHNRRSCYSPAVTRPRAFLDHHDDDG